MSVRQLYSYNILPFPEILSSCPNECDNPLDEVCMEKWGRCVHENFVSIYKKVGLLLYAVKCIVEICHMTVNSVSLHNGSYNTTNFYVTL